MVNACWPGCPHLMPNNMRMLEGSFSLLISGSGCPGWVIPNQCLNTKYLFKWSSFFDNYSILNAAFEKLLMFDLLCLGGHPRCFF